AGEISCTRLQSSHDRSLSESSPGNFPAISRRRTSLETSTVPSGEISRSVRTPGASATVRTLPDSETAQTLRGPSSREAVNHISPPDGGQDRPEMLAQSPPSILLPIVEMSRTRPASSCRTGCSTKAILSARGEKRTLLSHPGVL